MTLVLLPPDRRAIVGSPVRPTHEAVGEPTHGVLARGLAVLSAFGAQDAEVTLADLARRTGLAKSTVFRMCRELCVAELLEKTDGGYRLGLRIFELGALVPRQRSVRELSGPILADLHASTGRTVHLAIRDGLDVVYIDKLARRGAGPTLPSRIGGRMPLHCTAVGKALLAHTAGGEVFRAVVGRGLSRSTPYTQILPTLLAVQLQDVRRTGMAHDYEESTLGVTCLACPVLDTAGRAIAAVSVAGPSGQLPGPGVEAAVRLAAAVLSREWRAATTNHGTGGPA